MFSYYPQQKPAGDCADALLVSTLLGAATAGGLSQFNDLLKGLAVNAALGFEATGAELLELHATVTTSSSLTHFYLFFLIHVTRLIFQVCLKQFENLLPSIERSFFIKTWVLLKIWIFVYKNPGKESVSCVISKYTMINLMFL